jgi:DNA-binding CsgD family transcriptional regulator
MKKMRLTLVIIGIVLAVLFIAIILRLSQARKELQYIHGEQNLTDREREIFTLLLKGVSPKEIAHSLEISNSTVNFHRNNLYRKLGIQSIHELFARYSPVVPEGKTSQLSQN